MKPVRYAFTLAIGTAFFLLPQYRARAEDYPARPIRIVVPNPAGGSSDSAARMLGEHLTSAWRQPVVIENRPGGNAAIGTSVVAHAAPDGYTLLLGVPSLSTFKVYAKNPGFDVEKDFSPISEMMVSPYVVAVSTSLPVTTIQELITYAKANPGKLNYGGFAGGQTLASELFKKTAGIDLFRVPYQGEAPAVTALASDNVQIVLATAVTVVPMIEAGRVRALAVSTTQRLPSLPSVPTMTEAGLPEYDVGLWFGLLAPANTPADIQNKLAGEVAAFVKKPEVIQRFLPLGFITRSSTPDAFRNLIASEIKRWTDVAAFAGIGPQ